MKLIFESAGNTQKYNKESLKILATICDKMEESLAKEYWKIITSTVSQTALLAATDLLDATVIGTEPHEMVDKAIDAMFVGELARYSKEFTLEWKTEAFFDHVELNPDFFAQHLKVIESLVVAITEEAGHCALDHQKFAIAANHLIEAIQRDAELSPTLRKMNVDIQAFLPPKRVRSAKKKAIPSQWASTVVSAVRYQAQGAEEDLPSILNYSAIWRRFAALMPGHPAPSLPTPEQLANGDCIQFGGVRQSGSYYALWLHEGSMPWWTVENWDEDAVIAFFSVQCQQRNRSTSTGGDIPPQHDCFLIAHQDEYGYSLPTPFSLFSPETRSMPVRMGMAPKAVIPVHLDGQLLLPGSYWYRLVEAIQQADTDELSFYVKFEGTSWSVECDFDGDREEIWRSGEWTAQVQCENGYSITISQGSGCPFEECRDLLANHMTLVSQHDGR